ncbi:MAG: hypothetical protein HZB16_04885 [Armatimonadetes bacterium]|nr:hypothetical protein [Armatimonadota bacterium]
MHRWLPLLGNTITFEELSAPVMAALSSGKAPADHGLAAACCCLPNLSALLGGLFRRAQKEPVVLAEASRRAFRITSKLFMDAHTFCEQRVRHCCVHTATFEDDPRRHSFCWRWLFGDGPLPGDTP